MCVFVFDLGRTGIRIVWKAHNNNFSNGKKKMQQEFRKIAKHTQRLVDLEPNQNALVLELYSFTDLFLQLGLGKSIL